MRFEPVRVYLYALLIPVAAILVYYGIVDEESVPMWVGLVTAVLGVATTEAARSKVTPVAKLDALGITGEPPL